MRKLWEFEDKKVKVTLLSGDVIEGVVSSWDDPESMESGEQEITINDYSYADSEIKKIEVIEK